jgi:hypothetical protein
MASKITVMSKTFPVLLAGLLRAAEESKVLKPKKQQQ